MQVRNKNQINPADKHPKIQLRPRSISKCREGMYFETKGFLSFVCPGDISASVAVTPCITKLCYIRRVQKCKIILNTFL